MIDFPKERKIVDELKRCRSDIEKTRERVIENALALATPGPDSWHVLYERLNAATVDLRTLLEKEQEIDARLRAVQSEPYNGQQDSQASVPDA